MNEKEEQAYYLIRFLKQEGFDNLLTGKHPMQDRLVRKALAAMNPEIARLENELEKSFYEAVSKAKTGHAYIWLAREKKLYQHLGDQMDNWREVTSNPVDLGLEYHGQIDTPKGGVLAYIKR